MIFTENSKYLLEQSIFNREEGVSFRRILTCHCVQDGWVYLSDTPSSQVYTEKVEYKYITSRGRGCMCLIRCSRVGIVFRSIQWTEYGSSVVSSTNTSYESYKVI